MSCRGCKRSDEGAEKAHAVVAYDLKVAGKWLESAVPEFKLEASQRIAADAERRRAAIQQIMRTSSSMSAGKTSVDEQLRRQLHPRMASSKSEANQIGAVSSKEEEDMEATAVGDQEQHLGNATVTDFEERLRRGDYVKIRKLKTKGQAVRAVIRMNKLSKASQLAKDAGGETHDGASGGESYSEVAE
eukprot:SAG31_NODE_3435_length_4275_cov_15.841954_1_plen_188_part_00